MTNWDKSELKRQVIKLKEEGYSKTRVIEKLHYAYLWKRRTIKAYWEAVNGDF